ncbi:MAG: type II toxin-antitoxin system RelE/ParE family toxin [Pseudoxanthomonas sp.]
MTWTVRFTEEAEADLDRLGDWLFERSDYDIRLVERAVRTIRDSLKMLESMPFACPKVDEGEPLLRELLINFGNSGYVALYEIGDDDTVTVLALRHQREEDYH